MTSEVKLTRLKSTDIDERFVSWFQDDQLMLFYRGVAKKSNLTELIDELKLFESQGNVHVYGIFVADFDRCIGTIKIGPIDKANSISDLVVLLGDKSFHGKGIASKAISEGNRIAFEEFGIRKLFGGIFAENTSAINAYLKAGWFVEGIQKDHFVRNGKTIDRVLVACFNPKFLSAS